MFVLFFILFWGRRTGRSPISSHFGTKASIWLEGKPSADAFMRAPRASTSRKKATRIKRRMLGSTLRNASWKPPKPSRNDLLVTDFHTAQPGLTQGDVATSLLSHRARNTASAGVSERPADHGPGEGLLYSRTYRPPESVANNWIVLLYCIIVLYNCIV